MKRTTKRYVITTSALNCYSYRVLSSGVDFNQYRNNPIMLWMHQRATGDNTNQILPLGRVVEIRLEGDAWTGQPEFDENDTFAMSVYNKYESGILSMLSLGAIPLEVSSDAQYMLPGQQNTTVLACRVTDVSCVDIGGNPQALPVQLYDIGGNKIALSSYFQLAKKDKQAPAPQSGLKHKASTKAIVQNGVDAGKFDGHIAESLLSMGDDDDSVNTILSFVKNAKIQPENLEGKIPNALLPHVNKSYDELQMGYGGISDIKQYAPEVYKSKFFEKNGRLPAERDGKPL